MNPLLSISVRLGFFTTMIVGESPTSIPQLTDEDRNTRKNPRELTPLQLVTSTDEKHYSELRCGHPRAQTTPEVEWPQPSNS